MIDVVILGESNIREKKLEQIEKYAGLREELDSSNHFQ